MQQRRSGFLMTLGPPRRFTRAFRFGDPAPASRPSDLLRRSPQRPVPATCSNDPLPAICSDDPPASYPVVSLKRSAPTAPLPASPPRRLTPTSPAPRHPALAIPLHVLLLTDAFIFFTQLLSPSPPCSAVVPFRRITLPVLGAQPAALHAFSFASEFCMHSVSPRARFRPPGDTECMRKFLVNENACNASGAIWRRLRYDVGVRYGVGCDTACDMALLVTEACHSCGRTVRSSRQEQNEAHVFA